jgi:hypothetical protein
MLDEYDEDSSYELLFGFEGELENLDDDFPHIYIP